MRVTRLMMSYAVSVTGSLNWVVRSASEVETNIVSVSGQSVQAPHGAQLTDTNVLSGRACHGLW